MKIIGARFLLTAGVAVLTLTGITAPTAAAQDFRPAAGASSVLLPGMTGGEDGDDTGWG
ncbi:hypothetical protein [Streptomyces meridianus]|nr:hypothetical protein [Streptomyces meridianus]